MCEMSVNSIILGEPGGRGGQRGGGNEVEILLKRNNYEPPYIDVDSI